MARHLSTLRHLEVGPLTRRYELQHPGVVDHARQVRSITAKVGRHRAAPARSMFAGDDDVATVRLPRIVATASAPLGGAA